MSTVFLITPEVPNYLITSPENILKLYIESYETENDFSNRTMTVEFNSRRARLNILLRSQFEKLRRESEQVARKKVKG